MIEQGLRTLMVTDPGISALVDNRVYGVKLPQDPTMPAIVITKVFGDDKYSTEGNTGPSQGRFQVDCWADGLAGSRELEKVLRALLSGFQGAAGDELIQGAFMASSADLFDSELDKHRRTTDFNVYFNEVVTAADLRKGTLKQIAAEQIEVITPGTLINPTSNTAAVYVRVINNTNSLVMVGMQDDEVDALSDPVKGFPLNKFDSRLFAVVDSANELYIDANLASTKISIELFARN